MYLSIIVLPLTAASVAGLLGRKLGPTGVQIITISSLVITTIMVGIAFYEVGICGSPVYIKLPTWIDSGLLSVSWSFSFDTLSVVMLVPILIVSTFVQIYTVDYMREDPHVQRFFSYLTLFSFFMILLVAADNYLLMFLAWEGVGVVSFLLINFWFTRVAATKAAVLALTQNRVGDTLLTLGLFAVFWFAGNLDYASVFAIAPYVNETIITIVALLLLGGAAAKSAQLLLNTWLPHSMEGYRFSGDKQFITKYYLQIIVIFIMIYLVLLKQENNYIIESSIALSPRIKDAMIGDLLGDGYLGYPNKNKKGQFTGNCLFAMTLRDCDYVYHLWENIYQEICTSTPPRPWPNPNTGLPIQQYHFASRSLESLTSLHHEWYKLQSNKYIKIVPITIKDTLTDQGLAHWIMGDGYWDSKTVFLCTDNFSLEEVLLLIDTLKLVFNINAGLKSRIKSNKEQCWRIRISIKSIEDLRSRCLPYLIPSMYYKLGI